MLPPEAPQGLSSSPRPPEAPVRKRLLVLTGVVLAAAVSVPAALELHAYRHKLARGRLIDEAHFDRIKHGMSQAEVEAILGGPPGDFTTGAVIHDPGIAVLSGPLVRVEAWTGNEGQILVCFDQQGAVWISSYQTGTTPPSLADRVRTRLRRLWP
jgi:hypothetical protein